MNTISITDFSTLSNEFTRLINRATPIDGKMCTNVHSVVLNDSSYFTFPVIKFSIELTKNWEISYSVKTFPDEISLVQNISNVSKMIKKSFWNLMLEKGYFLDQEASGFKDYYKNTI